jgi:TRAP-type C4-dicarboxylate transport system permease small subunit
VKKALLALFALGAVLAAAIWFAWTGWWSVESVAQTQISAHGYLAMGLGVALSILIGGGLMALLFYSARHGHDDIDHDF